MTDVTSRSAVLEWLHGPGNISHYRLEVQVGNDLNKTMINANFTYLDDLIAGTSYSVKVFPVKCERDLNPQEAVFSTSEYLD